MHRRCRLRRRCLTHALSLAHSLFCRLPFSPSVSVSSSRSVHQILIDRVITHTSSFLSAHTSSCLSTRQHLANASSLSIASSISHTDTLALSFLSTAKIGLPIPTPVSCSPTSYQLASTVNCVFGLYISPHSPTTFLLPADYDPRPPHYFQLRSLLPNIH